MRQAVKLRYAETVDYREYEEKVRKLMDEHIKATSTTTITNLVNVFDVERFDAELKTLRPHGQGRYHPASHETHHQ